MTLGSPRADNAITMTQRPSTEQLRVLILLASGTGDIAYYQGGFWAPPGLKAAPFKPPIGWHAVIQTVRGLEKKGWVSAVPGTTYRKCPGLEHRRLTDLGRQVALKYVTLPSRTKPVVIEPKCPTTLRKPS